MEKLLSIMGKITTSRKAQIFRDDTTRKGIAAYWQI
jgi:hypothetical protein